MGRRVSLRERRRTGPGDGADPRARGDAGPRPARAAPARLGGPVPPPCGAHPARRGGPPGPRRPARVVPRAGGRGRPGRAPGDRRARGGAAAGTRAPWPRCSRAASAGRSAPWPRAPRPAPSPPSSPGGCRPSTAWSAIGVALDGDVMNVLQWSVRGVDARMSVPASKFQPYESFPGSRGPVPGGDAPRLRPDRVHRRPSGPRGAAPLAHARRARDRSPRADGSRRPVRLRLLRRHRQGGPR